KRATTNVLRFICMLFSFPIQKISPRHLGTSSCTNEKDHHSFPRKMVDHIQLGRSPGSQIIMPPYLPHISEWHTMGHSLYTVAGPRGFSVCTEPNFPIICWGSQQHQAYYAVVSRFFATKSQVPPVSW